ncbi:GNAT family N-acetyltransferase [Roseateles sp. NT4]|uniref:GNAT family N-acetyltransferase n=1 Tax=Roseateles sp. NT4 TaxID=3453715 RepID=UPI003EEDCF73
MTPPLYIDRTRFGLRLRDLFFADGRDLSPAGIDLIHAVQLPTPLPGSTDFYTSLIDLKQDEAQLLEGIGKGFRYEIRRAADKDGLITQFSTPDVQALAPFLGHYDAFAAGKGLAPANRAKLAALAARQALVLAIVSTPDGAWLAAHLYLVNHERTRLYHSASLTAEGADRQLVGRANKLLHWRALQHFKAAGLSTYDMGGISMGEALKAIDDFKQSFGGQLVREYNCLVPVSWKGHLALRLMRLAQAARRLRGSQ